MTTPDSAPEFVRILEAIDKLIHEPGRLMIVALLYIVESADFVFIMRQTGMTKGNLSAHLSKLEAGGYLSVNKQFIHKIPRTFLSLTPAGRQAFESYQQKIQQFWRDMPARDESH